MTPPLTGLGLFTRPTAPRPTSIAVHLGLTARPDRPWAVRVSAPLLRPGPDGLAHHVPEIERLAAVGQTIVAHTAAVFAAAVTTAASRTWLLYAASADVPPVAVPDYRLATITTADPAWAEYHALCPTDAELADVARGRAESDAVAAARSATHATLRSLRASGADLSRPRPVRYTVTTPDVAAADAFARQAVAHGLRPDPAGGFVRDDLPDLPLILRTERWLIRAAARHGGTYAGWAAA